MVNKNNLRILYPKKLQQVSIGHPGYLVLKPLAEQLRVEIAQLKNHDRESKIIIDIGCGLKPYRSLFSSFSNIYYGVDIGKDNLADVCGVASDLPLKDSIADIVLCTQLLEHSKDYGRVLTEIRRVLKQDGIVLLSTHGIFIYHPSPGDYWRWTHEGLCLAFSLSGLEVVKILPNGGAVACLIYLCATILERLTYRSRWLAPFRWFSIPFLNFIGEKLDSWFTRIYPDCKLLLVANYLVVSRKYLAVQ